MRAELADVLEGRHDSVRQVAQWFDADHLREGRIRDASELCSGLAEYMLTTIDDCPELTVGLRKLLEAKDCFVRATLYAGTPDVAEDDDAEPMQSQGDLHDIELRDPQ